ncbi:MAG: DUF805 domain-containing protein [Lentisphaeria bacterium]|nr:DUF805 domain-containing protein [Lentisphaeria bacterium]
MHWYLDVLKQYVAFEGRTGRKEFWMFVLCNFIVCAVLSIIANLIHLGFLVYLYDLAVLLPCLGLGARRLHDIGKSGWLQLIALIPLVGAIILIVLCAKEGIKGDNQYGAEPMAK